MLNNYLDDAKLKNLIYKLKLEINYAEEWFNTAKQSLHEMEEIYLDVQDKKRNTSHGKKLY